MNIDFVSLIKKSTAKIPDKRNLLGVLTTKSTKGNIKEKKLNLENHKNFQRCGDFVINISLFKSLKNDVYEYFKDKSNYFNLCDDEDFKRLDEFINNTKEDKLDSDTQTPIFNKEKMITELKDKYPDIYEKYNLENFSNFQYMEQGRVLIEISSKINSLSDICSYLNISTSTASKRTKAYKLLLSFPEDSELLMSLNCRCLEAFPSDYEIQKKIIELIKVEKISKINREYIINLHKSLNLNDSEKKLNQNIEVLKNVLEPKTIKSLSKKEVDRINKYFDRINKILKDNNIIEKGD